MKASLLSLLVFSILYIAATGEEITELYSVNEAQAATEPDYEVTAMYLYTSPEDDSIHKKLKELSKKVEGFVSFYSVSCTDLAEFAFCKTENAKPQLLLSRPPDYKVNPYTNKPMETLHAILKKEQLATVTVEDLTKNTLALLPNYIQTLEADTITHFQVIRNLNKAILFTAKDQAPPMFKALAAHYKNRMLVKLYT